jgi:hypothetical protein
MRAKSTAVSESWRNFKVQPRPSYDRLHPALRLVLRFHLMYLTIVYGAIKIWCADFRPTSDAQLEGNYESWRDRTLPSGNKTYWRTPQPVDFTHSAT